MVLPGDGMFQADIALHAWRIILLPYVVEIIADHPAQIAGFHHRHIRPHSGQGIDSCIPIIQGEVIGKEHRDL